MTDTERSGPGQAAPTNTNNTASTVPQPVPGVVGVMDAALKMAARGWSVFPVDHPHLPVCAGVNAKDHKPDCKRGKCPDGHWPSRSSRDAGDVFLMFSGLLRNVAVNCGLSGLLVVDEDVLGRFAEWVASIGQSIPATFTVRTGRLGGGRHYYFRLPSGVTVRNATDRPAAGIDIRSTSGYVVGPGSRHVSQADYVADDWEAPVAEAPQWLIDALDTTTPAAPPSTGGPDWWQKFAKGKEAQPASAANRAIDAKILEVSEWTDGGGKNFRDVLRDAAYTLGGYVGGGYLDENVARDRLDEAICQVFPAPDGDDGKWVEQGLTDGALSPFYVYTPEDELRYSDAAQAVAVQGEAPSQPPWSVFSVLGTEPFDPAGDGSDQGLAKAVAERMFPGLRYATDAKMWVVRDAHVWYEDPDDMSEWAVSAPADLMPPGCTPVPKDLAVRTEGHWQAVRWSLFQSSAGAGKVARKLRAILRAGHPCLVKVAHLDTNPELLWAGGVPWDLRASGELPTPARVDPGTPHLRTALCAPDPTCLTPRWDAFTAAVWPDPAIRAWALRVLSIALTGYPDAALPVLYGRERSGKTSLVQMLVTLLGSYGHAASPKLLAAQDNSHPEIVYDLKGRRLSFIDEGPRRGHDATERLKQITGGGSLNGRPMFGKSVTFVPSHTLAMTTNDEPHLTDPALRARMRLIPCDALENDVRPVRLALLGAGLIEEAPGILAALMRETAGYLADRDSASTDRAPESIRGLAGEIAKKQDPAREWVDCCTVPAEPGTPGRALYTSFCRWHQDSPIFKKLTPPTENLFGRSLTEMGYLPKKTKGLSYRPLSVLAAAVGIAPWELMPDPHMTRTPSFAASGEDLGSNAG